LYGVKSIPVGSENGLDSIWEFVLKDDSITQSIGKVEATTVNISTPYIKILKTSVVLDFNLFPP